jgi:hypothetical protein
MKQILDNPFNKHPTAFSDILFNKENEKIASLDKDYFGNPTNIMSNNLNLFVPFYLDKSSQLYQMYPPPVQTIMSESTSPDTITPSDLSIPSNLPTPTYLPIPSNLPTPTYLPIPSNLPTPTYLSIPSNSPTPTYLSIPSNSPTPTYLPISSNYPTLTEVFADVLASLSATTLLDGTNASVNVSNVGNLSPTDTPSPGSTDTPSPVSTGTPSPVSTGTPSPVSTGTPSPVSTGTPSPGSTDTPSPVSTGTPSPVSIGTPSPISTGTPSPSLNLNSIFATVAPLNYVSHNPYFSNGKDNITLIDDSGPNNFFLPRIDITRE